MKRLFLLLVANLIILHEVNCFHHHRYHRKRSKSLMKRIPISKPPLSNVGDRETLKEALQLLNVGKKTLGLNTEDPDLLLQLVENPNEKNKSESIEKLLEDPKQIPHAPIGKQFLALSGENGKVRVDNFTNVTPSPNEKSIVPRNDSDIQDVFKMVMEKKSPDSQSKVFHKITIIETNQLKPYSNKELSHSSNSFKRRRRHKGLHLGRRFHIPPHIRHKRSKFVPIFDYFHRKHSTNSNEMPFFRKQNPKKRNATNFRDSDNPKIEISLSKFPNPAYGNKRTYGNFFKDPEDNFHDKDFLPSEDDRFERKENTKVGREKPNTDNNNLRFGEENLEKLIDAIGFESSLKTVFPKSTPRAVITEGNLINIMQNDKTSTATITKTTIVNRDTHSKEEKLFPEMDVVQDLLKPIIYLLYILEVMAIIGLILLLTLESFKFGLAVCRKLNWVTPIPSEDTTQKKKEQALRKEEVNKNYLYSGLLCYKTASVEENDHGLCSLEWQSESGDWLSDIEGKDKL